MPDFSARANQFALLPDFVYNNVVGSLPGANDLNLFVGMLDTGAETKASLAILAAESSFNLANINLVGLVRTGIEFS